jgi:hypothetical protein
VQEAIHRERLFHRPKLLRQKLEPLTTKRQLEDWQRLSDDVLLWQCAETNSCSTRERAEHRANVASELANFGLIPCTTLRD